MADAPHPDLEEEARQRIADILRSDACQKIDLEYGGFHLEGGSYRMLAGDLVSPERSHDRLRIKAGSVRGDLKAGYDRRKNILIIPTLSFGSGGTGEEALIVHECTHAVVSQRAGSPGVSRLDEEILAYLAQALYVLNNERYFTAQAPTILQEAFALAETIKDQPGAPLSVQDVAKLGAAIKEHADYAGMKW
jgi:hypothetical protein